MAREKLTVLEVKEPQSVGSKGAQMLKFRAKGADDKAHWFTTFRPTLFDAIKVDAVLEVDVELKTREHEGTEYTDRQVSQIYIGGQPVAVRGRQPYGFNGRKSPEEIESIERQVAAKIVAESWIAGKLKDEDTEVKELRGWMLRQLSNGGNDKPSSPAATTPKKEKAESSQSIDMSPIKHAGDLFTRAKKNFDLGKEATLHTFGGTEDELKADLNAAWRGIVAKLSIGKPDKQEGEQEELPIE